MPRFLYLVRHGDASPHDEPLSATGREQAWLVGARLRPVRSCHRPRPAAPARCPGPLPRAAQTAAIIADGFPGVPVTASEPADPLAPTAPSAQAPSTPRSRIPSPANH
jgi:probable phosphoglycerate mutase